MNLSRQFNLNSDTIAAIATPSGNGGVGIIRISGSAVTDIAKKISNKPLIPRRAIFTAFRDHDQTIIDTGIMLYFPAPASFTGENILELQAHGGMVVMNMLLRRVLKLGARHANPGEFSERAFINGKMDLYQAEAIADLINSTTERSARSAQKSLQGEFSRKIDLLLEDLIELRAYVEAAIDFVEEEIDFLADGIVEKRLQEVLRRINEILQTAQQGRLLRDGMNVVIAGKPNAGKSSLLNALAGHEAAIVTEIAGTTRDILKEHIQIDGMPIHIIDTAGIRTSENQIEREGIRRAFEEINKADVILLLIDVCAPETDEFSQVFPASSKITKVYNKIDLLGIEPKIKITNQETQLYLSIKTAQGLDLLKQHLKQIAGYNDQSENVFIARSRHLIALQKAQSNVQKALQQLRTDQAGELVAEDLKQAQKALSEITGEFTSDDLLGEIFSSFCIGK